MADGHWSPARPEGSGPVSGTQITVSGGELVGRLTDGALGAGGTEDDGPSEGEGTGPQATSRAQSRAAAKGFIVR
jgi:hypothetical protein